MHTDPWMVAILLPEPPIKDAVCKALGSTVERRESRHDVAIKPDYSLLARRNDSTVLVDLFSRPWQDTAGNDQGPTSPNYLTDATHNHLLSAPWALHRAVQQYRGNDDATVHVAKHSAFILLRVPLQPGGNRPDAFCQLLHFAERLLNTIDGSCFFNPRGEALFGTSHLHEVCDRYAQEQLPPLDLIINTRVNPLPQGWSLADTVGLAQLDLVDHEVVFMPAQMEPADALAYARKLAIHVIQHRPSIAAGETAGGPGGVWEALPLGQGAVAPMRPVIRWLPEDRKHLPKSLELP